jgi:purine-nucleoside/S-methyl-5'-thioadenosine phosphorylase / adenosine deaminase
VAGDPDRAGINEVSLPGARVFFADATVSPPGLAAEDLAEMALAHLRGSLGPAIALLWARQEHTRIGFSFGASHGLAPRAHLVGTADALLTAEPKVALLVRTADCLPIALAGEGVVAMVHAGWRGLAADILGATVRRLYNEYGVVAGHLDAVVGVGVGPCHYEVGNDVLDALRPHPVAARGWQRDGRLDLAGWARGRLEALGLAPEHLRVLWGCTACSRSYHSYRRDGAAAGRQWSAIVSTADLKPAGRSRG